jgi:hypothetical protein
MDLLELLTSCIEQERTAIAPVLVDAAERGRLNQLQEMGALVATQARAIICPRCEAHSVRIMTAGSAFCVDCGPVSLSPKDVERLMPDGDWLRRRIAQALDLAGEPAWTMVPGRVWRIGDVGRSGQRHRVLFGLQLTDTMIQRVLLAVWPTHVGEIRTVMVTTSPTDRVFLPGVAVRLVPLAAAFRVRGGGLVADEAVWAGMLAALPATAGQVRVGPFAQDYRSVMLPGESLTIALTPAQSALLRVLWEHRGSPIHRELLIAHAKLELDKPVEAFPRPKYPDANRAYRILVRSNRQGQYWWAHEALGTAPVRDD